MKQLIFNLIGISLAGTILLGCNLSNKPHAEPQKVVVTSEQERPMVLTTPEPPTPEVTEPKAPEPTSSTDGATYHFTAEQLYPDPKERDGFINHAMVPGTSDINGVILDASFNSEPPIMKIKADDGDEYIVFFYPDNTSAAVHSDLMLAIQAGRKIKATIALAGASTFNLIAARITK